MRLNRRMAETKMDILGRLKKAFFSVSPRHRADADVLLGRAGFQAKVQSSLQASLPEADISVIENFKISLVLPGRETQTIYLDNAFHAYSAEDPERRHELIARYLRSWVAITKPQETALDMVVPMVKSRAWLSDMQDALTDASSGISLLLSEPLNDELHIVYAINSADSIAYASSEQITGLGLQVQELRAEATRNMRGLIPGITIERGPLVSMVVAGGDFEASLILFPDLWEREAARMKGRPVFAIPARDLLLFADSANVLGIDELRALAVRMHAESTYPLTDDLFVVKEGEFEILRK